MVTEQDIERAGTALDEAQAGVLALTSAWRHIIPSRERGAALAAAQGRMVLAEQALEGLIQQRELEQAELAARPGREKDAGKYIATAGKDLEASRARIAAAAEAAQSAMVELLDAAQAHNALVYQTAGELAAQGLAVDQDHDHQTAGAIAGGKPIVRLKGSWWPSVQSNTLLAWVTYRVAEARLSRTDALTSFLRFFGGQRQLAARSDGLLAQVPDVPEVPRVERVRVEWPQMRAPVNITSNTKHAIERQLKEELLGWFTTTKEGDRRRAEPPESVKESVSRRLAMLEEVVRDTEQRIEEAHRKRAESAS